MKTKIRTIFAAFAVAGLIASSAIVYAGEPAFFGMQVQGLVPDIAAALGRDRPDGVLVRDVALESPAGRAGVLRGDLIVEFANEKVDSFERLLAIVRELEAGDDLDITVVRKGERRKLAMATTAWPAAWRISKGEVAVIPNRGITLAALTQNVRESFGLRWGTTGVVVSAMKSEPVGVTASGTDLRPGEVIVQVNQRDVWSPRQILDAFKEARKEGRGNLLLLIEGDAGARNGFRFSLLPVD